MAKIIKAAEKKNPKENTKKNKDNKTKAKEKVLSANNVDIKIVNPDPIKKTISSKSLVDKDVNQSSISTKNSSKNNNDEKIVDGKSQIKNISTKVVPNFVLPKNAPISIKSVAKRISPKKILAKNDITKKIVGSKNKLIVLPEIIPDLLFKLGINKIQNVTNQISYSDNKLNSFFQYPFSDIDGLKITIDYYRKLNLLK